MIKERGAEQRRRKTNWRDRSMSQNVTYSRNTTTVVMAEHAETPSCTLLKNLTSTPNLKEAITCKGDECESVQLFARVSESQA
jgi:hypothetical protein